MATGCSSSEEASGTDENQLFEIPTDIDVEFDVIKMSVEEREKLVEESRQLKESIKEKNIKHHR